MVFCGKNCVEVRFAAGEFAAGECASHWQKTSENKIIADSPLDSYFTFYLFVMLEIYCITDQHKHSRELNIILQIQVCGVEVRSA